MSADRVRSGARAGLPGVGTLDAAGGPVAWCRDTVRATRRVGDLDARLDAVCARAPRTPALVRGPVLGHALDDCLRRLDRGEPLGVEDAAGTGTWAREGSGTGWDGASHRRPWGRGEAHPSGGVVDPAPSPRARPFGRVGPASVLAPPRGPASAASGGSEKPGSRGAAGVHRLGSADGTRVGGAVTVDRLRALAGPVTLRAAAGPPAHDRSQEVGRARRRGPGTEASPAPGPRSVTGPEHAVVVAARVLRRIAGRPGSAVELARSLPRPDAGPADQTLVDLLARWSTWRALGADLTDDESSDARDARNTRDGTAAPGGARRRRRGRGRAEPGAPAGDRVGTTGGPEPAPARLPTTPRADEQLVRSPSRFGEQPTRPRRLTDLVDPPPDEDAAGDAGPGTDGVGLRPGLARVAVDTSAATGVGGTVPTVSAPELERVLARVLRDAASRHGIEV
ncbi:hypothetical protein DDP54_06940 [Cellulomonas sp. WB94]|uniref:hypothetical protein n=1 Tax=Cellulomonas sp. WB94 TaxID=2173174 RepID=UPI000D56AD0F|nr:hypothetical protein [Cellulomonas sp. WB94]PVU82789.1 hypothetical protein DDP54_06940 [Cellulomonas sp. WB94]